LFNSSLGVRDRIHISQETADLLIAAGKEHWVTAREDAVQVKGKGEMWTFWVDPTVTKKKSVSSARSTSTEDIVDLENACLKQEALKKSRLVSWMAGLFEKYLKDILANRPTGAAINGPKPSEATVVPLSGPCQTALDEVAEVIHLPKFDAARVDSRRAIEADTAVLDQLRDFISVIASTYQDNNPFHNFEHACKFLCH
jgi:hypothetical protein